MGERVLGKNEVSGSIPDKGSKSVRQDLRRSNRKINSVFGTEQVSVSPDGKLRRLIVIPRYYNINLISHSAKQNGYFNPSEIVEEKS